MRTNTHTHTGRTLKPLSNLAGIISFPSASKNSFSASALAVCGLAQAAAPLLPAPAPRAVAVSVCAVWWFRKSV